MHFLWIFILFFISFSTAYAEKRVALIIGNSNYQNTAPLTNPKNDSDDISAKLKTLGFEVIEAHNLDRRGFDEKLAIFGRAIQEADVAIFFYAGHGVQYGGQNYLMPVDAKIQDEFSLRFEMTRMDDVMNVIGSSRANVKIVILDACRDNPLASQLSKTGTRSAIGKGLAPLEKVTGMIVAYATQANSVAQDGTGRNSPFTTAFLHHINEENLEVGTFFRRVATDVNKATKGAQTPELSVSMLGEFYFKQAETDSQVWGTLRNSNNDADLKAFQKRFPNSPFIDAAQSRLVILEREKRDREIEVRIKAEEEEKRRVIEAARIQRIASLKAELEQLNKGDTSVATTPPSMPSAINTIAPIVPLKPVETVKAAPSKTVEPTKIEIPKIEEPKAPPVLVAALPAPLVPVAQGIDGKVVVGIKGELKRLGCYFGRNDEKWETPQMKAGLAAFARETKIDATTLKPKQALLDTLKGQTQRICPLTCGNGEVKRGDVCVEKTCGRGQELNDDGDCEKIYVEPPTPVKKPKATPKVVAAQKPIAQKAGLSANEIYAKCRARNPTAFNLSTGMLMPHGMYVMSACQANGGN